MTINKNYAQVAWITDDVLSEAEALGIDITLEDAIKLLEETEEEIREGMFAAGWDTISNAIKQKVKLSVK